MLISYKCQLFDILVTTLKSSNFMQVIIMAGGFGSRLQGVTRDAIPKSLVEVNHKPLLDHVIENTIKNGCDNIIICTGHLGHQIQEFIASKRYDASIFISRENKPLGTAGGLHLISDLLDEEFFVVYADVYTTINFKKMLQFHKKREADVTIAVHVSDHPYDSTVVKIERDGRFLEMIEKPGDEWRKYRNLTQTSLYIVKKDALGFVRQNAKQDFETDVFPAMLKKKKRIYGYVTEEYTKDLGTAERYYKHINKLKTESSSK